MYLPMPVFFIFMVCAILGAIVILMSVLFLLWGLILNISEYIVNKREKNKAQACVCDEKKPINSKSKTINKERKKSPKSDNGK